MVRNSRSEHWEKLAFVGAPDTAAGGGGEGSSDGVQAAEGDPPGERGTDSNRDGVFISAAAREEENEDGSSRVSNSSRVGERWQGEGRGARRFVLASNLPRFRPKGRRGTDIAVRRQQTPLQWFRDSYNWLLKVPNNIFILLIIACPLALAAASTPPFLLLSHGFSYSDSLIGSPPRIDLSSPSPSLTRILLADRLLFLLWAAYKWTSWKLFFSLHVFIFALSICTSFNGSPLEPHSPKLIILSNAVAGLSQLMFVFLSGAVFARIGRPAESIRSARCAVICDQAVQGHSDEVQRLLLARFALVGPNSHELVNASITLTLRILLATSNGSMFSSSHLLPLVRSEMAMFKFGLTIRHVIDDESPLAGLTVQDLIDGDASLTLSVSAQERSSLQPIFHVQEYYAADGEILFDYEFEDMVQISPSGEPFINHNRLHLVRPSPT